MTAEGVANLVTIADLARKRQQHPSTVRRWLLRLHAEHGGVVRRVGAGRNAKLYTTKAALARVDPLFAEPDMDVRASLGELRAALVEVRRDMGALMDRLTAVGARMRDLAGRVGALENRDSIALGTRGS